MKRQLTPEEQEEADIKLVMGPLSCTPGFFERRNAAIDRLKVSEPAWELWRWDERPFKPLPMDGRPLNYVIAKRK